MVMKKFINDPANLTDELLEGLALANADLIELQPNHLVVNKKLGSADRVTVVSMGGSGHEPCCAGFTGEGMLDIAVIGVISLPLPALSPVLRHYRRHSAEKVFCTSS